MFKLVPRTIASAPKGLQFFCFSSAKPKDYSFFDHKFTDDLNFVNAVDKMKCFRVMDEEGKVINKPFDNSIPKETILKIFKTMVFMHEVDLIWNIAQRQNRISFYMTGLGEEASTVGSAAALDNEDFIFPQYREASALYWRGYPLRSMVDQMMGNKHDLGKGRQMPVHYGSKEHHYQTISSPLCTQVPQAAGSGYYYRISGQNKIAVTYFGDGAASEGDFHAALNFAATLQAQTLFFCRNNMYAISTPVDDQYRGDGIAIRGIAYGMNSIRVDGNDVIAVYNAVKEARRLILENKRPALVETISYRMGDHSTSDFSKMYRDNTEMLKWNELLAKLGDPIYRIQKYIEAKGFLENAEETRKGWAEQAKKEAIDCLKAGEGEKLPHYDQMFEDVYDHIPQHLVEQREELREHLQKYGKHYPLDKFTG